MEKNIFLLPKKPKIYFSSQVYTRSPYEKETQKRSIYLKNHGINKKIFSILPILHILYNTYLFETRKNIVMFCLKEASHTMTIIWKKHLQNGVETLPRYVNTIRQVIGIIMLTN